MRSLLLSVSASLLALNAFAFGNGPSVSLTQLKPNLHLGMPKAAKPWTATGNGRALSFGYYQFDSGKLNNYLSTNSSIHTSFDNNYIAVGIDDISATDTHFPDIIGSLQFIIPQKVTAGTNDSLKLRMGGWHYTMSIFSFDVIQGRTVALVVATQVSYGNLKIKRNEAGRNTKYTNPFVAPGGRAELRFTFGRFMIGARATYRYDITHSLWKRKDDMMPVLPTYKNNGMGYTGYIGWIFGDD